MALGTVASIWLYTARACDAGVAPVGPVPVTAWQLRETIEGYVVAPRLTITLAIGWARQSSILGRRILRVYHLDGATVDFDEYRITRIKTNVRAGTLTVEAQGIIFDLAEQCDLITGTDASSALGAIITSRILTGMPSGWSLGTVTPTNVVELTYTATSGLAILIAGCQAVEAMTGVHYEVVARRNGVADYKIDVVIYNGSATVPDVRSRKNLIDVGLETATTEQATRLYPSTEGGFAAPHYEITAISANTYIEVQGLGAEGGGPAREDDQYNASSFWIEEKNATSHAVTDSVRLSFGLTRLLMTSTASMAVGERGYLATSSGAAAMVLAKSPALEAIWGKKVGRLQCGDGFVNYARNPDLSGAADPPSGGWAKSGTVTYETTAGLFIRGGRSAKMKPTGSTNLLDPPLGTTIACVAGDTITYTVTIYIDAFAPSAGIMFISLNDPQTGATSTYEMDGSVSDLATTKTWLTFSRTFAITSTGNKTLFARFTAQGSSIAPFYLVDSVQVTKTPGVVDWRRGSDAANNITAANRYFDLNGAPPSTYEIDCLDLYGLAPALWSPDAIRVGGSMALTNPETGLVRASFRVVDLVRTSRAPTNPKLTISTLKSRITATLVGLGSTSTSVTTNVTTGGFGSSSTGYALVEEEGVPVTARTTLNFAGAGVTATDSGGKTLVTIPGGGGGGGNSVTVPVNFGASFTDRADTVVTGQSWVATTSEIVVQILTPAGVDPDEMRLLAMRAEISALVAGTGFTVSVFSEPEAKGSYDVMCVGV